MSKIVAGLANPTAGYVTFEGRNVHEEYEALRTRIGMVPQDDAAHETDIAGSTQVRGRTAPAHRLSKADRDKVIEECSPSCS